MIKIKKTDDKIIHTAGFDSLKPADPKKAYLSTITKSKNNNIDGAKQEHDSVIKQRRKFRLTTS